MNFFKNIFTILLRCTNYLAGQTNEAKYEGYLCRELRFRIFSQATLKLYLSNLVRNISNYFLDFLVTFILRKFANEFFWQFHGPCHVSRLVFRFRSKYPGTFFLFSENFPL